MRTKVTLVLIFLNVALFFFIFKFERDWDRKRIYETTRTRVLGPEAADIRLLTVKSTAANGSFSLVRNRDTWWLTEPLDWPANPHAASTIVNQLQLLQHETSFAVADLAKNNLSLADYGLDQPKITVEFSSSDPTAPSGAKRPMTTLQIGDLTKDGKLLYILSPDRERVHIVGRSLIDSLSLPLDQLRGEMLMSVRVFEARSLSIVQTVSPEFPRSSARVRIRRERDGARWTFESPHTARANKTLVELRISELNALRAKSFPASAPSPAAAPMLRVTLEGNNRHETLFIGEPVPVPAGPRPAPAAGTPASVEHYAQLEGRNAVFTVALPAVLMNDLRNAQESLREPRILDFDSSAVTRIELSSPMQPNQPPLTLQRLEPPAGQPATIAPPWQVVQRGQGAQTSQTLPADRAAVQRLLDQLSLLTARAFKSDAPTSSDLEDWGFNRPARELTLTLAGNAAPIILRLGTDATRSFTYARVGSPADPGSFIYEVAPEIEAELQLSPLAWRDRTVIEPLPAAAKITGLKLTDLSSKQVVLDTTFNAAGEPSAPPRDPKALADLMNAVRAPRARAFVAGGFSEKVAAAGEDRPWRYQLETTVVQPGAGGVEQTHTSAWLFTERLGGAQQYAGSKELDLVFSLEQAWMDALWSLTYGERDPGPRPEQKR